MTRATNAVMPRVTVPSRLRAMIRGAIGRPNRSRPYPEHLQATMHWLAAAVCPGTAGISYGYGLRSGYLPAYPETTGYIIPSFYDYANHCGDGRWRDLARQLADWEIDVQMASGAVQSGLLAPARKQRPAVFNTGQVMLGWARAFTETGDERYLAAMRRAAEWLVARIDPDGCWRTDLSATAGTPEHSYNARTAWALACFAGLTNEPHFAAAAARNIDWVMAQQAADGWVGSNTFYDDWPSLTHNIAYVMEGLVETGRLLGNDAAIACAERIAERLLRYYEVHQHLPGGFYEGWQPDPRRYRCLTGDAQIAGVWLQFSSLRGDLRYLNAALRLLDDVGLTQDLGSTNPGIRGGIAGSYPLHGFYAPMTYLSWATKFFADSLMVAIRCQRDLVAQPGNGEPN